LLRVEDATANAEATVNVRACVQGVAANLGPEQTKLWLLTSIAAVGMQIVTEPFKMLFSVALLQLVVRHLPELNPT